MTAQEEKYIHFVSCIDNLNRAWKILQDICKNKDNNLAGSAFQFALIEYSKPYKYSRSAANKGAKYKLEDTYVPVEYNELHKRILDARDQIHAHADLTVKEAILYVSNTLSTRCATIVQNVIYGTEEFSNIGEIIDLIEQTLDRMYIKVKQMEKSLPVNSKS